MVFSVEARQSGNTGTSSAQTLTTNSATPTPDSLFLTCSVGQNDGVGSAPSFQSPSGGSLSYTQVEGVGDDTTIPWDGSAQFRLHGVMYRADVGGAPSAFAVTLDHSSGTQVFYYAGLCLDITGHNDVAPITQSASNGADGGAGNSVVGTVTLAATPAVGSLVVVMFGAGADGGGGFAAPTFGGQAMTQVFNQDTAFTQAGVWYRVVDGTEATDTITCSDLGQTVGNWVAIAVEVAAGAASDTEGAFTLTAPPSTAAFTGAVEAEGALDLDAPPSTGAFTAQNLVDGAFDLDAPVSQGAFTAQNLVDGAFDLDAPPSTAAFTAQSDEDTVLAELEAVAPPAEAAFTAGNAVTGDVDAVAPASVATFEATHFIISEGDLEAVAPAAEGSFAGNTDIVAAGELAATAPAAQGSFTGDIEINPDRLIKPVDVRPRRRFSRLFPVRWRDVSP